MLAMMVLISGVALFSFTRFFRNRDVRRAADHLVLFAKQGLREAYAQNRAASVVFGEEEFHLAVESRADSAGEASATPKAKDARTSWPIPDGVTISLLPWQGKDWVPAAGQLWRIGAGGLCEPMRFRFQRGSETLEFALQTLTATPMEETHVAD